MNQNQTLMEKFVDAIEKLNIKQKQLVWYTTDAVLFVLSSYLSGVFFYKLINLPDKYVITYTLIAYVTYLILSYITQLGSRIKRYTTLYDVALVFTVVLVSSLVGNLSVSWIYKLMSVRFEIVAGLIAASLVTGTRLLWRIAYSTRYHAKFDPVPKNKQEKMVLIGAGDGGSLFMNSYDRMRKDHQVVAILDENKGKIGMNLKGVPIVGDLSELPRLVEEEHVTKAVIAIPSLTQQDYERILTECSRLGGSVYNMPRVEDVLLGTHSKKNELREINISDLLGRKQIELDDSALRNEIEGKVILITGAGGSIGSEVTRQVSKWNPRQVVLLGHGENSIYTIYHELLENNNKMTQYVPVIADIKDYEAIKLAFEKYQPDIVYHAAAHKHVPMMEANPSETVKNNVIGTYNVAKAVDEVGVPKMVMVSTDKAVRPTNIMGASKRIAELVVTAMQEQSDSIYCAVRFGNVLGSRGSVVPAFQKMIDEGGPVRVTDFRMIRYFMTIPEASQLIIYAGAHAEGGEVFILDMGEPVKIVDLARKMILLNGYSEDEIGIVESGIRPGEKLYEELLTDSESVDRKLNDKLFIGRVQTLQLSEMEDLIEDLQTIQYDDKKLKEFMIKFANDSAE